MSIYARCCGKDYSPTKKKCIKCNKSINKFVARVKDSVSGRWKTKTVATLKLAKEVESKFKTEILEGNVFDKKKTGEINFEVYIEHHWCPTVNST